MLTEQEKLFPIFEATRRGPVRVGYMDAAGNTVIAPRFSLGLEFLEGRAPVLRGKKWHYIDYFGEIAFPGEFGNAERFSEGRAYVIAAPRKYGYVDLSGRIVGEAKYRWTCHFAEGRAGVYSGKYAGFIDRDGAEVVPLQFEALDSFNEGLAAVRVHGKWGYINRDGETVIPFQLKQPFASRFRNGLAPVRSSGGGEGFINRAGSMAIQPRFQFTYGFTEGLASVQIDGRWGYIDAGGNFVIPPKFARAYPFSDGLAAVVVNSPKPHIGFIDRSGDFRIAPRFSLGFRFHDGLCWTETERISGYINPNGEYIWQCPRVETNMTARI